MSVPTQSGKPFQGIIDNAGRSEIGSIDKIVKVTSRDGDWQSDTDRKLTMESLQWCFPRDLTSMLYGTLFRQPCVMARLTIRNDRLVRCEWFGPENEDSRPVNSQGLRHRNILCSRGLRHRNPDLAYPLLCTSDDQNFMRHLLLTFYLTGEGPERVCILSDNATVKQVYDWLYEMPLPLNFHLVLFDTCGCNNGHCGAITDCELATTVEIVEPGYSLTKNQQLLKQYHEEWHRGIKEEPRCPWSRHTVTTPIRTCGHVFALWGCLRDPFPPESKEAAEIAPEFQFRYYYEDEDSMNVYTDPLTQLPVEVGCGTYFPKQPYRPSFEFLPNHFYFMCTIE